MATIRDVENSLKTLIVGSVYPNGTSNEPITGIGKIVKIRIGWPISESLDADLLLGNSVVSIFPVGHSDKNTTRFFWYWQKSEISSATLFVNILHNTIEITGSVTIPQAIVVIYNKVAYGYEVQATDTLDSIASNISALIPGATSVSNVITLVNVQHLKASVVVNGKVAREVKRQTKLFYTSIFSPNPIDREILGDAIDLNLGKQIRFYFDDGTAAPVSYVAIEEMDRYEKNIVYQRDLIYKIEFPTTDYIETNTIENITVNLTS